MAPVVAPDAVPPGAVLADVRFYLNGRSARGGYDEGHLPGAVYIDLERWLAAPASAVAGRHPLPSPEVFAEGMSSCGIGDDTAVVACDDAGGVVAARLVWLLRMLGHDAALLDGGYSPTSTLEPAVQRAVFTAKPWPPSLIADIDDAADPRNIVVDARPGDRFRGENEQVDARAGHIPGALSVPCRENLGADGMFLPVGELRRRFEAVGITDAGGVISSCGSGVTACHNLLAMEHAGLGRGRLYPGSWSQYARAFDRPVATG